MITLRPTANCLRAIEVLTRAATDARNVAAMTDTYAMPSSYRIWANNQVRMLSGLLPEYELERLLTTRQYWLIQTVDAKSYGSTELATFVKQELDAGAEAMDAAVKLLRAEYWRWNETDDLHGGSGRPKHALVLDTNVFLHHWNELKRIDTICEVELRTDASIAIALVPQVLRELDAAKQSQKKIKVGGLEVFTMNEARKAIREIDVLLPEPSRVAILQQQSIDPSNQMTREISMMLTVDDVDRVPIADHDAEIVDRAKSIQVFANGVTVVSYDTGIIMKAAQAGLNVKKLYEDDGIVQGNTA